MIFEREYKVRLSYSALQDGFGSDGHSCERQLAFTIEVDRPYFHIIKPPTRHSDHPPIGVVVFGLIQDNIRTTSSLFYVQFKTLWRRPWMEDDLGWRLYLNTTWRLIQDFFNLFQDYFKITSRPLLIFFISIRDAVKWELSKTLMNIVAVKQLFGDYLRTLLRPL